MNLPQEAKDWVTVASAVLTSAVALLAWRISAQQARYSREKLRLDLYNKRLDIFERTLLFYQAVVVYDGAKGADFETRHVDFIRAAKESQFLFADDSGIHDGLNKILFAAGRIRGFKEEGRKLVGDPPEFTEWSDKTQDDLASLPFKIDAIEKAMAPYLDFHKIAA